MRTGLEERRLIRHRLTHARCGGRRGAHLVGVPPVP